MTGRGDRLARAIERAFAPVPVRVGITVYSGSERVGTVAVDERRGLCGSACRLCGGATYDHPLVLAVGWLVAHLREQHGIVHLDVDTAALRREWGLGPGRFDAARTVERAVTGPLRGAA